MLSKLNFELFESKDLSLTVLSIAEVVLIFLIAYLLSKLIRKILISHAKRKKPAYVGQYNSLTQLIKYFIYAIALFLSLSAIGLNLAILTAGSAAILVIIGFGLQHIFHDFVSGIIILFEGILKVGDIVEIQSSVVRVKHIGLRTSHIETRNGITIIIPNSKLVSDSVINWSHQTSDHARINIRFSVDINTDIHLLRNVLLELSAGQKDILTKPVPKVRFSDFNESGFVFDLQVWTSNLFAVETVKSNLRFRIIEEFRKNNFKISFPHRQLDCNVWDSK
ncbi:MAG: mechanosensitive ion channel [Bacteroidia bacterium]|nr:mechanosensitive ion channel [Bacteroidia bacterium]